MLHIRCFSPTVPQMFTSDIKDYVCVVSLVPVCLGPHPPHPPPPLDIRDAIHSAVHTLYSRSHHLSLAPSPSHLELTENPCNVMYAQKSNCTCLILFEMSQCAW